MTSAIYDLLRAVMRERFGNSLTRLSEACGVPVQLTSKWVAEDERKRTIPRPPSCQKLAAGLGLDPDYVLELAGHRTPREPRTQISAARQSVQDQVERWLTAVGPDYEAYFWAHIKAQGDSTERLIRDLRTAVNAVEDTAINPPVSDRGKRGRRPRKGGNGPLGIAQHGVGERLADRRIATGHHPMMADRRRAA